VIAELTALRDERARLLGYPSFAHYKLDDTMAKTPACRDRPARRGVGAGAPPRRRGARAPAEHGRREGGNFALAPWDWRYFAEKLRKARYDLDESEIKPYLPLESIIEAAFYTANRLFGLSLQAAQRRARSIIPTCAYGRSAPRTDAHRRVLRRLFRAALKRSGAWMTSLRDQEKLDGEIRPLVLNVMNFNKGANGEPTLLSFDDARTLFH
jgi:peptidyl-dipeptidase Dcp